MKLNMAVVSDNFRNRGSVWKDLSLWFLLISNLLMLYLALSQNWNIRSVIFTFWLQSIIIGCFSFLKILSLSDKSFNFLLNKVLVKNIFYQKISYAFFFVGHYGFFCFWTLIVAMLITRTDKWILIVPEIKNIMLMGGVFFINHLFSFVYNNFKNDYGDSLAVIYLFPYIRILPLIFMFFVIPLTSGLYILNGMDKVVLFLFLLLKTFLDMIAHVFQHKAK